MSSATPRNEHLLSQLSQEPRDTYARIAAATEKLIAERPDFAPAYQEYRQAWLEHAIKSDRRVMQVRREVEAKGVRPQYADLKKMRDNDANAFASDVNRRMAKYGQTGDEAGKALEGELNKSVGSGIVSNVYDKSQGGVQWGGVAGALLGGLLLMNMAGGTGTWFGIFAIAVGALAGSWLGDMAGDAVRNKMNANQTKKSDTPAPGKGKAQQPEVSPEAMERAKRAVLDGSTPETPEQEPSQTNLPAPGNTPAASVKPAAGKGKE